MLTDEDKATLAERDAILFDDTASANLIDYLTPYTVPLITFRGNREVPAKIGSGTLLNLDGRGYILTAGHVVADVLDADACSATIAKTRHQFYARFSRSAHRLRKGTSVDVGVLEIEQTQFEAYRSYDRMYVQQAAQIRVCRPSELVEWNDWMLVAGYPSEKALLTPGSGGMRHVQHFTTIAGIGPAPASPLTGPDPCCSIDLWVPRDGQMQAFPHYESNVEVPAFDGMSGGGCWKTGARSKDAAFDPANPRPQLVAVHIGSTLRFPELDHARFGREVLIGHHLRLLADEFPDMRESVLRRWPHAADDAWRIV